jgi:hypothetical protein
MSAPLETRSEPSRSSARPPAQGSEIKSVGAAVETVSTAPYGARKMEPESDEQMKTLAPSGSYARPVGRETAEEKVVTLKALSEASQSRRRMALLSVSETKMAPSQSVAAPAGPENRARDATPFAVPLAPVTEPARVETMQRFVGAAEAEGEREGLNVLLGEADALPEHQRRGKTKRAVESAAGASAGQSERMRTAPGCARPPFPGTEVGTGDGAPPEASPATAVPPPRKAAERDVPPAPAPALSAPVPQAWPLHQPAPPAPARSDV